MLPAVIVTEIDCFLSYIPQLSIEDFVIIDEHAHRNYNVQVGSLDLLKLSAADSGSLKRKVRNVVSPLLSSLTWPPGGLASVTVSRVMMATQAIARRDRLTAEQYDSFVGGFREAGVPVPEQGGSQ